MQKQVEQLYSPLYRYIKKRINNQLDAEDLTQEVFYKLSRSNNDQVENIKSWLYTIAKNTITDYYRKRKIVTEEVGEIGFLEDNEDKNAINELSNCIAPFLNELPEEYRAIMILSELEDISQKEIAESLEMNYVTVRSKIQRGRKKLKKLVTECCTVVQGGKGSIIDYAKNNDCDQDC